ncbi:MAG TPA: TlpA disulfide reductase family protein [Thermoanaerobaculia bacterium]|nr:TlpA disulfide reductase family protein [Thermoanaerobaculia bacterium]
MTRERRCGRTSPTAALPARALLALAVGAALLSAPAHPGWADGRGAAESRLRQGGRPLPAALRPGDAAPEAILETLDGDYLRVSQLRGKVVVLDFWATWCGPCMAALPSLKRLAQAHGDRPDRPFALVSVSADTNGARLREFVASHEMGWTQCWDGNSDAQRAYGVRNLPTYFVIDPAGRILYVKAGWGRSTEQELGRQVEKALAEGAAARQAAAARR